MVCLAPTPALRATFPVMPSPEQWNEKTPPESLSAMRKAIEANTATSNAALEWSVKTYNLVAPLVESNKVLVSRVVRAERMVRWPLVAASIAVLASLAGVACELVR